ncbi:unnamed protein product [Protopolystoma xenopodis]|uniref:Uncharacterized protein n=1 Tax=Protopolystoma xenopodis TaxID=117903 RepID=A0A3S5CIW5_9PLAT|nr:unnamed protein product [Protopolystoma xenopodis]
MATSADGLHLMLHENLANDDRLTLPSSDILEAGTSRAAVVISGRFGEKVSVELGQFIAHLL